MAFRPGELDQLITIQRKVNASDDMGGQGVDSWADLFDLWALARPASGRESVDYDRVQGEAKYLFVVRYPVEILDEDRIMWGGVPFNIRFRRQPTGRDLYMQIEAERGVAQ